MNDQNRIVNAVTGEEIPPMFGRGGMKKTLEEIQTPTTPVAVNNANITLNRYGSLGNEGSVRVTYIDFDNDTRTEEIIDADVFEKRRRDEYETRRRVRPRNDESPTPFPPSDRAAPNEIPNAMPIDDRPVQSSSTPTTNPPSNVTPQNKKFRLGSELGETVTAAKVGEQMMDTPMQFSMRQIMAVAPEVAGYLHDQTRKRRIPVDATTTASAKTTTGNTESVSSPYVNVNSTQARTFYACPSGHAKVTIDQQLTVHALLDNGSEVNMMPRRVFERLGLPIDTDIKWKINTYNTDSELEGLGPIGVCHAVPIDIGGVEVKQPVFIVEHATQDLLLGRPWERAVRAEFINEDDGSYTARIKSPDGRRIVQFCACKSDHERNREFARHPENGWSGEDPLKV